MDISPPSPPLPDNCRSPQSASQSVIPCPPVKAPHRRSSLAFSQLLQAAEPSCLGDQHPVAPYTAVNTPSRSLSNIGRKRALASPLARQSPTPGHVSQMQKIFQDAKASLQLDAAIASSPACSIASRLPGTGAAKGIDHQSCITAFKATEWRYSTAPQHLAEADVDVREPFPAGSPDLPDHDSTNDRHILGTAKEPISSGFTSPVAAQEGDVVGGNDVALAGLPASSSSTREKSTTGPLPSSGGHASALTATCTELEQPMTNMRVNHVDAWLHGLLQDPPNAQRGRERGWNRSEGQPPTAPGRVDMDDIGETVDQPNIILSTPAKAAAMSAKLKRNLLGGCGRTSSNKENMRPTSDGVPHALRCVTPTANLLAVPLVRITPSPHVPHGSPPPRAVHPPVPLPLGPRFGNVDPTGSPFPTSKPRSPQPLDMSASYHQWQGYYASSPREQFASPPQQLQTSPPYHQRIPVHYSSPQQHPFASPPTQPLPFFEAVTPCNSSSPTLNSQQSVSIHPPPGLPRTPRAPRAPVAGRPYYSFSTAAAAKSGSSFAPDSRIRDAYRTDTLTPFELPTTRFRKIGPGAPAQNKGAWAHFGGRGWVANDAVAGRRPSKAAAGVRRPLQVDDPRTGLARANVGGAARYYANMQGRTMGARSPEGVTFRSSPPRAFGDFQSVPRRKKVRRSLSVGDDAGGDGDGGGGGGQEELLASRMEERMCDVNDGQERGQEITGDDGAAQWRGIARSTPESEGETSVLLSAESEVEDNSDDWMCSTRAVCGNDRMFIKKKVITRMTTRPKHDIATSLTPDQTRRGGGSGDEYRDGEDEIRELSPYVTPYRKGRGPNKFRAEERRPSYWDADILPGNGEGQRIDPGTGEDQVGKWAEINGLVEDDEGVPMEVEHGSNDIG